MSMSCDLGTHATTAWSRTSDTAGNPPPRRPRKRSSRVNSTPASVSENPNEITQNRTSRPKIKKCKLLWLSFPNYFIDKSFSSWGCPQNLVLWQHLLWVPFDPFSGGLNLHALIDSFKGGQVRECHRGFSWIRVLVILPRKIERAPNLAFQECGEILELLLIRFTRFVPSAQTFPSPVSG